MTRPLSDILQLIYDRAELCSSILQANDQCLQYRDITSGEHLLADKSIMRWLETLEGDIAEQPFSKRRTAFKGWIKKVKESENYAIR